MIRLCFSWLSWVVGVVAIPHPNGGMIFSLYLGPFRVEYWRVDTKPF